MAKDTEKLIRQLSLISFLMAERRPVSALEIKQDVEGYSEMNDDAFARRFYADRAELEALGIDLKVEKPPEGYFEAELYTLPPENFYLPAIEFSDGELAALQTALALLDGRFAYAEPLRLALQQLSWGRPSPLASGNQHQGVAMAVTASAGGRELSQRLAKVETAISRRKTIEFAYYSIERDDKSKRKIDPYHLLYQSGQFYLVGHSHERDAMRVFRLSRIMDKVSYASKAEHDFTPPEDFDPWAYARRADWQLGEPEGSAQVWISERIAWLVERDFGQHGKFAPVTESGNQWRAGSRRVPGPGVVFATEYAQPRQLVSWVLGLGEHARLLDPSELVDETAERLSTIVERHAEPHPDFVADPATRRRADAITSNGHQAEDHDSQGETVIRPERFARLVALAGILIQSARGDARPRVADVTERLQITEEELREDLDVLNIVNFGGGSYVLYAEVQGDEIEVDPEPYSDNFARPARLLPLEAKALIAAIDLLGDHLPEGSLASARQKIVAALGDDPSHEGLQIAPPVGDDEEMSRTINRAIVGSRLISMEYYKENEDEFTERTVEPYALINGREGWYVFSYDLDREATRHFRLDRIKHAKLSRKTFEPRPEVDPTADLEGWPRTGAVPASRVARVWIAPERARWERERRAVSEELADGALIVELPFAGVQWLVREVLKEAGDAAVLEPDDARTAVHEAAKALAGKRRRTKAAA